MGSGNPIKTITRAAGTIVGGALGGPIGAAVGGALSTAATGGRGREITLGAVGAGIGASLGGQAATAVFGRSSSGILGSALPMYGASIGQTVGTAMAQALVPPTAGRFDTLPVPTFDQLTARAMNEAEAAAQESGIAGILNRNRLMNRAHNIDVYNRVLFPPLRRTAKHRRREAQLKRIQERDDGI